ncbi:lasso peptide biosynthesis B2 protein [Spongiactinospora sp. TRM90649]|uniref:lasso peptide biosynthesis B2 protein n=1 Tax=Spongiactinospora sp. TRM90649 TaxID=3031114 RepID=UPI0023F71AA4|nr:lasso peptide biosynthesis B2 protein [Spongiactinospora sp. TRM90649]MDF5752458.1 lasso peptide biosynthesis B2 protein [Spongiactinospora sp. TRM90649]
MSHPMTPERRHRPPLRRWAPALLCRLHGAWPTWCTGVRTDPFRAHAWVQVDGRPIGEPFPPGYYQPTMIIPTRPGA